MDIPREEKIDQCGSQVRSRLIFIVVLYISDGFTDMLGWDSKWIAELDKRKKAKDRARAGAGRLDMSEASGTSGGK